MPLIAWANLVQSGLSREPIPADVALQLRKEAGFGCCKCGFPFYEYHHIVEYATDPHNRPEDMMILCPNCHAQATSKALSEHEQRGFKKHPFNIIKGYADGLFKIDQNALVVSFGTVQFIRDGFLFKVDQEQLIAIGLSEGGRLELTLRLYSKKDNLIALIEKNEWKTGKKFPWDLQAGWRWLRIRNKLYNVALEIDARQIPVQIRGNLWRHGQHFELTGLGIKFNGVIRNFSMRNLCQVGMYFLADTKAKTLQIVPDERFHQGVMVSETNVAERIRKGLQAWDDLVNGRPFPEQIYTAKRVAHDQFLITAEKKP
jgi:HNH endonuclease